MNIETNNHTIVKRQLSRFKEPHHHILHVEKKSYGLAVSILIIVLFYTLIAIDVAPRVLVALLFACLSLAAVCAIRTMPSAFELVASIDVNTLLLMLGAMLLVAQAAPSGVFDWLAVALYRCAEGRAWHLLNALGMLAFVLALLLDNVTAVVVMMPLVFRCCEFGQLRVMPVVLFVLFVCNIGGLVSTIGGAPNRLLWRYDLSEVRE